MKRRQDNTMTWIRNVCMICTFLLILPACGYKFSGGGSLPGGVETVAVGIVDNLSGETGVEGVISNGLIYEFTRNGKITSRKNESADAILRGAVLSITSSSVSRNSIHDVAERSVTVTISLEMVASDGSVVWQVSSLSESEDYEVASDRGTTEMNKRNAIKELSIRLAERAYYRMTDDF